MHEEGAAFRNYFDREREVLRVYGEPPPLHQDLDLHLMAHGIQHDPFTVRILKDGLSAIAVYLVSRPRFESFAWSLLLPEFSLGIFLAGRAREGSVVGRAFRKDYGDRPRRAVFHAQTARPQSPLQTSSVEVSGVDFFDIVEQYCRLSDQQPVRLFTADDGDRVALLMAFRDAAREWFERVERADVMTAVEGEQLKLLEERPIRFRCGCHRTRILDIIAPIYGNRPDELFGGESQIEVECPRCAAVHTIQRSRFLRHIRGPDDGA